MTATDEFASTLDRAGFATLRAVFTESEIAGLCADSDRLRHLDPAGREATGCRWLFAAGPDGQGVLRGVQDAHRISDAVRAARSNPQLLTTIAVVLGDHLKSPLVTLFWKPAGMTATAVAFHQDSMFRRPSERYRNLTSSYLQVGIAIDEHGPSNGGMQVVAGSHRLGDLGRLRDASVLEVDPEATALANAGFDERAVENIVLDAGDIAVWHPHLLHGSPANPSPTSERRFLVVAYMRADDCDVGDEIER